MSRSTLTLLVWAITAVAITIIWKPLSWARSGDRVTFEIEAYPLLALIAISVAALVLHRRSKRHGRTPDADKSGRSDES
jgi:hypothetical protein